MPHTFQNLTEALRIPAAAARMLIESNPQKALGYALKPALQR
jgi:hypothetical protein